MCSNDVIRTSRNIDISKRMYNIIIYVYLLGVAITSLFNEKVRKMWRGERDAIRVLRSKVDPKAQYVWFHAASLGEFEQGRPLMEQLRREHPEYKILLTFFSPSGYEVRKNYQGADIICYLPLDTITNAQRFLHTIRLVMAFFIKYEFWYNYLHILKRLEHLSTWTNIFPLVWAPVCPCVEVLYAFLRAE